MSQAHALTMPWAHDRNLYCTPGRIIVKVSLGEAPESIPTARDIRLGASEAARQFDGGGGLDRVLRKFTERFKVRRIYAAAASVGKHRDGERHKGYDGLEHAIGLSRTFRLDVDRETSISNLADALRHVATVEEVSPHYLCTLPFAPAGEVAAFDSEQAWSTRDQINAREAMAYATGDAAIIIAIVDTGVVLDHVELRARLRAGYDTVDLSPRDLSPGIKPVGDWQGKDTEADDFVGHGTSCAGIIGAKGERIPPGLAGACSLLPIRVLGAAQVPYKGDPIGIGAISNIDAGLKRAIDLGAKVLNMSFGTPETSLAEHDPPSHADVVRYGLARGCVMVAASGNSGETQRFLPAALDGVIAVGSVGPSGKPSSFTTRGDHVALSAPGEKIVSTGLRGYQVGSGTSFAAPFVSAAAALLISRAEQRSESLDGRDVYRLLRESARPFTARDQAQGCGAGVLDVIAALRTLDREIDRDTAFTLEPGEILAQSESSGMKQRA